MKEEIQIQSVLDYWELRNPCIEEQLHKDSPRPVYKIKTDSGRFILKGFPEKTPETTVQSNMKAHLFLGNEKGLAPRIYPLKEGGYYILDQGFRFYLMEFIEGRQMEETPEDEYRLGRAVKELHALQGYSQRSPEDPSKKRFYAWFRNRAFVREFDAILDEIPDFDKLDMCFIHSDIGPHNAMIREDGKVIFIDLAESFLKGYYGDTEITREEYDLLFYGAEQMHISYMQCYGEDAVESLWKILKFGIDQKEILWRKILCAK